MEAWKKREKLTVASHFPIYPAFSGGQLRTAELYSRLSQWFDIDLVTFTHASQKDGVLEIAPGFREVRVPKSVQHQNAEDALFKEIGVPVADVAMPQFCRLSPAYMKALSESARSADVVVTSHPYLYSAIREISNKMLWYDAQDVEGSLKPRMLPNTVGGRKLVEETIKIEQLCCTDSSLIMVCSDNDRKLMGDLYGVQPSKVVTVPNGVDTQQVAFVPWKERLSNKPDSERFNCIFLGSYHAPNIAAVNHIVEQAAHLSEVDFLIVGDVCREFKFEGVPPNVKLFGMVDDETKGELLKKADVALNPITYGSGTNLKMLEYFAAGLPVITTPVGARGLGLENGKNAIITDMNQFNDAIRLIKNSSVNKIRSMIDNARLLAEESFDWQVIADRLADSIRERGLLKGKVPKRLNKKSIVLIPSNIKKLVGNRPILIWGAGSGGRETLECFIKMDVQVTGFIDKDPEKWETTIRGVKVYAPASLIHLEEKQEKPFVIIASIYAREIRQELESWGYKDQLDYKQQDVTVPCIFLL